jgi:hypothetical protein
MRAAAGGDDTGGEGEKGDAGIGTLTKKNAGANCGIIRPPAAPKTKLILSLVRYVVKPHFNASGRYKKVPETQCFRDFLV